MKRRNRVAVDSTALLAYAKRDEAALAMFAEFLANDVLLIAPAPVLAETLRGNGADAGIKEAVVKMEPAATTNAAGQLAGELLGRAPSWLTMDALILATAIEAGADGLVTTDVAEHRRLAPPGFAVIPLHKR